KAGLYRYDPQTLGIVDRNGFAFSETAEFLGFLLSGRQRPVPVSRERLRDTLPYARPIFGKHGELGELRTVADSRIFGMMELRDYPEASKPGHLDRLLGLPHEFVLTQSWGSHTGAAAKKLVKKHHKLLVDSGDDSVSQVTQLADVMDDLTSARLGLGDHHATLLVYGTSADSVRQALAQTATALAEDAVGFRPLDR